MSEIWSKLYSGLHVKYTLFFSEFIDTWIFPTDFEKILKMCAKKFSTTFVWNISDSKKKWAKYDQNCIVVFT